MKSTVNSLRVTSQNTANGRPGTFRKLAGAIALLLASGNVMAKDEGHYISNRFIDVEEAIALAVEKHGAKNVLIALAIQVN
ncbi:MAG: hypothetical protein NT027_03090 [Proteobacteria bacterium]|nr:hypothetical protein [Pseudomonadota bacterium]